MMFMSFPHFAFSCPSAFFWFSSFLFPPREEKSLLTFTQSLDLGVHCDTNDVFFFPNRQCNLAFLNPRFFRLIYHLSRSKNNLKQSSTFNSLSFSFLSLFALKLLDFREHSIGRFKRKRRSFKNFLFRIIIYGLKVFLLRFSVIINLPFSRNSWNVDEVREKLGIISIVP